MKGEGYLLYTLGRNEFGGGTTYACMTHTSRKVAERHAPHQQIPEHTDQCLETSLKVYHSGGWSKVM